MIMKNMGNMGVEKTDNKILCQNFGRILITYYKNSSGENADFLSGSWYNCDKYVKVKVTNSFIITIYTLAKN